MYRVLIVDDEVLVISSLKGRINWTDYGFEVIGEARNGIAAYDKILELKPDIVFTDIRMAGMDGLELIQKVNEEAINVQVVVISGYAEFTYAKKALNYGALGFCLKPFDEAEIGEILKKSARIIDKSKTVSKTINDVNYKPYTGVEEGNDTYKRILQYINENFCRDISVQSIAEKFQANPNYISQLFKKEKGRTFTEYLTTIRVEHACKILRTTDLPVCEVADEAGYNDYFHFAKVFKKITGKTPTAYREDNNAG